MIYNPLVRLRSLFKHPLLAAYTLVAGFVALGRELNLIRDAIGGNLSPGIADILPYVVDASVANILIAMVWPSFFLALGDRGWLALAVATYLVLVGLLSHAARSRDGRSRVGAEDEAG